ncbi:MAG: hypothetical protein GEU28_08580 [Dehalococcoidia bacterium]|nr:hypothetical protein [Dehalococcoidia bacterium]
MKTPTPEPAGPDDWGPNLASMLDGPGWNHPGADPDGSRLAPLTGESGVIMWNAARDEIGAPLLLAVLSSPRAATTWLRSVLSTLYGLHVLTNVLPGDVDWERLPRHCLLHGHWSPFLGATGRPPEDVHATLRSLLARDDFRVITAARHPLDALISLLRFVKVNDLPWPSPLPDSADPTGDGFIDFATSPQAVGYLDVTTDWWNLPGVLRFRYEDFFFDPRAAIEAATSGIGRHPLESIEAVLESNSRSVMAARQPDHVWHGQPGLWRTLLTADSAYGIAAAHQRVFATLGYVCDPDPSLADEQARLNWLALQPGDQ